MGHWNDLRSFNKLPITGVKESLNLSIDLFDDIEFSNIKILDIRQKNQIVIND